MIKDFEEISEKYKYLVLKIIGYGADEKRVIEAIEALPMEIQKKVYMLGEASPEKLDEYYKEAYLNVSVAGCAILGAKNSVVTLSPRHYSEECEVYGFLSKSLPNYLLDKPGERILPYIDELMEMSEEAYLECCKASFEAIPQGELNPEYVFSMKTQSRKLSYFDMLAIKALGLYKKISFKLKSHDRV